MSDFNNLINFLNPYRGQNGDRRREEYQFIRIDNDFINENQDLKSNNLTRVIRYKDGRPFNNPFSEIITELPLYVSTANKSLTYFFQKDFNGQTKYISIEDLIKGETSEENFLALDDSAFIAIRVVTEEALFYNEEQNSVYLLNVVLREVIISVRKTLEYNPKELGGLSSGVYYVDYTNAKGYRDNFIDRTLGKITTEISEEDLNRRHVNLTLNPKPGKLYRFPDFQIDKDQVTVYYDYDMIENDDYEVEPLKEDYAIKLKFRDPEGFLGFMVEVYFLNGVSILNTTEGSGNRKSDFSTKYIEIIQILLKKRSKNNITEKLTYLYYVPQEIFQKKFRGLNFGEEYLWQLVQEAAEEAITNFRTNKEDIVLKLLEAIKLNQDDEYNVDQKKNDLFLEELLKRRTKDKSSLLYKLTKRIDGEQFIKFIDFIWQIWKNSSYAVTEETKNEKVKITKTSPVLLDYRTNKVLGFYTDNAEITWKDEQNQLDVTVRVKSGEKEVPKPRINFDDGKVTFEDTGETRIIDVFQHIDYQYHPFSPISFVNSENPQFLLQDGETTNATKTILPAFVLFANNEKAFWENVFTSLEYALDVVTTISGVANIIKAGRLLRVLQKGKTVFYKTTQGVKTVAEFADGVVEVTSGTVNALLKLTGAEDTELGKLAAKYLFYLEMASLAGGISASLERKLKNTATELVKNSKFEGSLDDLVKKGDLNDVDKVKITAEMRLISKKGIKKRLDVDRVAQKFVRFVSVKSDDVSKIIKKAEEDILKLAKGPNGKTLPENQLEYAFIYNESKGFRTLKPFTSNAKTYINIDDAFDVGELTIDRLKSFKGAIYTHNHPNFTRFSNADIKTFLQYQLKEMRAINTDGIIYSIKLKNGFKLTRQEVTKGFKVLRRKKKQWIKQFNLNIKEETDRILLQDFEEEFLLNTFGNKIDYRIFI
ncbi:hypothetical protein [Tenacibaculum jejuense]|uniref:Uncharacterized protein n=1 Tax=Tenacibaculum jejuense TaxID=584609 RepID=A0A238UHF3_9FLAO|nr:hypothetical protein [Tenacibaculum jejuense]SNR17720.1 protein of unknown function [Tenacibaculum jejuense]